MRQAKIVRNTAETKISLELNLDGGRIAIDSGNGFFDHMLQLLSAHGGFGLELNCQGDTQVDFHHSCEDIGIVLGRAFDKALGDRSGICRYGWLALPMDEALLLVSVDISGRGMLCFDAQMPADRVGEFDTELVKEFWLAFCRESGITLHIRQLAGENTHHIIEGIFKACARSLSMAAALNQTKAGQIPSTKGTIK